MKREIKEIDTGVVLPESGVVDTAWARTQLENTDAFAKELMYFGKGSVFFLLKTNLSQEGYEQSVRELDYSIETAELYIRYLQKRTVLEAIKTKYYVALSLSASELIPEATEDALALCDVCLAKYGRLTTDNLRKAAETTGTMPKKMSDAAISIEAMKKKALYDWLLSEHNMTESDVQDAQRLHPEGRQEFTSKMSQAYFVLGDWKTFYDVIAETVHKSENMKALRFLADMNDASSSIEEYLQAEVANQKLNRLKGIFEDEVYPELNFASSKED